MKKSLLLLMLVAIPLVLACNSPTDSFASEVTLNKPGIIYDLSRLGSLNNVNFDGSSYVLQSVYSNLATIISKDGDTISIRNQIPVVTETKKIPYTEFTSSFTGGKININRPLSYYNGWTINKYSSNLELVKDEKRVSVSFSNANYELLFQLYKRYANCDSCDGKCIYSKYGDVCIPQSDIKDISNILIYSGLITSQDQIFYNYKIIGIGERSVSDLYPQASIENIDFQEAMKQELSWLKLQGVISLDDSDIQQISILSYKGSSGNQRVVYSNESKWDHYYNLIQVSERELVCKDFPQSAIPKSLPSGITGSVISSPYYFVPIFTSVFLIVLLIILIVTARTICSKNSKTCSIQDKTK